MKRVCLWPRCPELTRSTYCIAHTRAKDQQRGTPAQRGYDAAWYARARRQRTTHPVCEECGSRDDLTADHIVPGNPRSAIRTLCRSCNSARANRMRAL